MDKFVDEVLRIKKGRLEELPARSMREGLMGKTLEDALQTLLENYPQILPGRQISPGMETPPQFVLLKREMPVGSWSLDHLYSDQNGVLTLVEAKLVENPQSRREVIGQIVEYAANAQESWSADRVRQLSVEYYANRDMDLESVLTKAFGDNFDEDSFWSDVEDNLKRRRIRLIILADELRSEVRRMIEFLNEEMQTVEVLGLELACYGRDEHELTLVPRIVGQSQATSERRTTASKRINWNQESFEKALLELEPRELIEPMTEIYEAVKTMGALRFSSNIKPSFGVDSATKNRFISFYGDGRVYAWIKPAPFREGAEECKKWLEALQTLSLVDPELTMDAIEDGRYLSRNVSQLDDKQIKGLIEAIRTHVATPR